MKFDGKQMLRRLGAVLAAVSIMALTGCGNFFTAQNNTTGSGSSSFSYVINAGGTLGEYALTSGALSAFSGSPVSLPLAPTAMAMAPNNLSLYIGTADGVFLYNIGSDGSLTEGNDDTIVYLNQNLTTPQIQSMVVDATSSWLIMTYHNSTEIDALPLDPTTGLASGAAVETATLAAGATTPMLAISPSNAYLAVALGPVGTELLAFTASSTGNPFPTSAIAVIGPSSSSYSATAVAMDPNSTYLYATEANTASSTTSGKLRFFTLSNGKELSGSPYTTGVGPAAVLPDASGDYVYVANETDSTLSGFTVSATAQTLTAFSATIPTATSPVALVEDPSKTYIYAIGVGANPDLWLYTFDTSDANGALDIVTTTSTLSTTPSEAIGIVSTF